MESITGRLESRVMPSWEPCANKWIFGRRPTTAGPARNVSTRYSLLLYTHVYYSQFFDIFKFLVSELDGIDVDWIARNTSQAVRT